MRVAHCTKIASIGSRVIARETKTRRSGSLLLNSNGGCDPLPREDLCPGTAWRILP